MIPDSVISLEANPCNRPAYSVRTLPFRRISVSSDRSVHSHRYVQPGALVGMVLLFAIGLVNLHVEQTAARPKSEVPPPPPPPPHTHTHTCTVACVRAGWVMSEVLVAGMCPYI